MSIFDASVQDDWARDDLIAKIKAAEKKYYDESPCLHCGPGNGCDDCRGCEDSKRNYELEKMLRNAKEAYKDRFGHSYDEEYEPKYNVTYDTANKDKVKMTANEKRDLKIDKGVSIKDWIEYNIKNHGAKNFFDCVNNSWDEISDDIKQALLDEIQTKIKPEKIDTIEDLAKLLDGNEYRDELQNDYKINIYDLCKEKGWVIAYGASDDLLELEGAISDELGAWNGCIAQFYKKDSYYPEYEEENTYRKAKEDIFYPIDESTLKIAKENNYKDTVVIESLWCPTGTDMSWQINVAGAPCVKFNVMEDEEVYCEAAIIDMNKFLTK